MKWNLIQIRFYLRIIILQYQKKNKLKKTKYNNR